MSILLPSASVRLENVSKSFGGKAVVRNVSFEVKPGETLVILGTSGSGKTTTLRMINRLITRDSGKIYLNDTDVDTHDASLLRRQIGYVLQDYGLFPHFTVAQNIGTVPRLSDWKKEDINARVITLLDKLHLPATQYADQYPAQLSGGQQQRVGLARALAANPPVLLMDEPFGALDPVTRASIRKEFRELDEIRTKSVIMVTHDVAEAIELGTTICLMDQGEVQQLGPATDLLFRPANDFVHHFFNEQRLLLELKALTLQDVRPWLPSTPVHTTKVNILTGQHSCWEALEETTADTSLIVDFGDEQRSVQTNTLLEAVARYKQTAIHGNTANPA